MSDIGKYEKEKEDSTPSSMCNDDKEENVGIQGLEPTTVIKDDEYFNSLEKKFSGLQETTSALEKRVKTLERENDQLCTEVAVLQARLGRGDFNPTTTKVLHFKMNPATIEKTRREDKELELLRAENSSLQLKLKLLQDQGGKVSLEEMQKLENSLEHSTQENLKLNITLDQLKTQIKEKELLMTRLTEVCKRKLQEFKEVCSQLFGYKIEFADEHGKRYRLQSIYAQSDQENLLFQYSQKKMLLLETEYSKTLTKEIQAYLKICNSIPAFVSDITLALFQKKLLQCSFQ